MRCYVVKVGDRYVCEPSAGHFELTSKQSEASRFQFRRTAEDHADIFGDEVGDGEYTRAVRLRRCRKGGGK